jgi:hypothetical protein
MYTVTLRSNSRDETVVIPELSTLHSYYDLLEVNAAADPYVTAKNLASDEPKDWYAMPVSASE